MSTLYPPNEVPEWASDQTNNTPPMSAQKHTGWTVGQKAASAYDNWWKYLAYTWILFVQSLFDSLANMILPGNFTAGGASFTFTDFTYTASASTDQLTKTAHGLHTGLGPVRTTNSGGGLPGGLAAATDYYVIKIDNDNWKMATTRANAIAGVAIDITSAGTGTQTLNCQAGTTRIADVTATRNLVVNGNASVGGTLGVTGLLTPSGGVAAHTVTGLLTAAAGVTVPTGQAVTLSGSTTLAVGGTTTATGLITANGGLTAAANQNITVSGTGKLVHGTVTLSVHGASAVAANGGTAPTITAAGALFTNVATAVVPLAIKSGTTIIAVRARIVDSAGTTYQIKFADTGSELDTGNTSAGSGAAQTLTVSGLSYVVPALTGPCVLLARTGGTGTMNVTMVEVDYQQT